MRNFIHIKKRYYDKEIKKNEMGEACSIHARYQNCIRLWLENLKGRCRLEEPDVDGNNIKVTQRNWVVGGEWIDLAQGMNQWQLL